MFIMLWSSFRFVVLLIVMAICHSFVDVVLIFWSIFMTCNDWMINLKDNKMKIKKMMMKNCIKIVRVLKCRKKFIWTIDEKEKQLEWNHKLEELKIEELKNWRIEELKIEELKNWRIKELKNWRIEELKNWRIDIYKNFEKNK